MSCFVTTHRNRSRRGFSLIELLVVIGIIVLLAGILIPVISNAMRSGDEAKTALDLQSISLALDTYKSDFGDIPRFETNTADPLNEDEDRGAKLLARALFGLAPADDGGVASGDPMYMFEDGYDGYGFRVPNRTGSLGQVHGPYLSPDDFTLAVDKSVYPTAAEQVAANFTILTAAEKPILYYPGAKRQPNFASGPGYIGNAGAGVRQQSMYNAFDNSAYIPPADLATMLGDTSGDGFIGAGESARTTKPFLLIAPDAGGQYVSEDVVTNFD